MSADYYLARLVDKISVFGPRVLVAVIAVILIVTALQLWDQHLGHQRMAAEIERREARRGRRR